MQNCLLQPTSRSRIFLCFNYQQPQKGRINNLRKRWQLHGSKAKTGPRERQFCPFTNKIGAANIRYYQTNRIVQQKYQCTNRRPHKCQILLLSIAADLKCFLIGMTIQVEEDANAKRGYLDFSLKQIQDFLLDYANNKTATEIKVDLDRKTKIVRVIANLFLKNSKMFLLCPVLTHAPPTVNKYLLDMVEGIGNVGTIIEVAPPIPKKDAKFVYFSVFNMKNQSSRLFMKKPKLGKSRITVNRTLEKSTEKTILTDNDSVLFCNIPSLHKQDTSQPNQSLKPLKQVPSFVQSPNPNLRKLTGSTLDYNYPSFDATKPGSKLSKKVGLTKPILSVKTPSSTKMDLSGYKARIEKVAQSMDVGSNLEEKYEFDAKSHLKKRFPISKNAEQLVDELGNRVLELELENKQTKYLYKNMVKDLENKLAYAYQKLQMLEGKTPYHELFETYNKEMRKYEKQIELIRNSFVETITAHELAYNSILQKDNVGRKDKLLLNEMRVLQRNNRKFLVDLKTKDLELTAFKSKEKTWIAEHKELDDLRKEAVKYQKELTRTENTIQSNEVAMEGSEKAMAHLKSQYDALDVKNRENEKLIMALQGQIDRLTVKLQAGKIMDKLDKPLKLPKLIPNTGPFEIPERKDKGSLQPAPLTVDKAVLVKTHSQIKQCKAQITETLKTVRDETKEYANANLFAATDSLERAIALLLKILGDLEMRELNYLNTISQFTGSSPLRGQPITQLCYVQFVQIIQRLIWAYCEQINKRYEQERRCIESIREDTIRDFVPGLQGEGGNFIPRPQGTEGVQLPQRTRQVADRNVVPKLQDPVGGLVPRLHYQVGGLVPRQALKASAQPYDFFIDDYVRYYIRMQLVFLQIIRYSDRICQFCLSLSNYRSICY
eukprot:TRINITY_DN455_c0_g1_i2.p1 TRINITY_DN455_c0_g1~~TRINITY_DN455_c0_g1_i2.p1  ORF type:complete len:887 (-),score=49.51 TRINITY_DN455_c0_g1_i2:3792-6452(-)